MTQRELTVRRTRDDREIPVAGECTIDPTHTSVELFGRHLMITKVRGRFPNVAGTTTVDEEPERSQRRSRDRGRQPRQRRPPRPAACSWAGRSASSSTSNPSPGHARRRDRSRHARVTTDPALRPGTGRPDSEVFSLLRGWPAHGARLFVATMSASILMRVGRDHPPRASSGSSGGIERACSCAARRNSSDE
jgi:hypothetical protein